MNAPSTLATTPPPSPPAGVAPNLWNAAGGIWRISARRVFARRQLFHLIWSTALMAGLAMVWTREGSAESFHTWVSKFYLTMLVPLLAFMSGAAAIRDDMKPGSVDYLLTRPMPRTAFVAARFVSHLLCTQVMFLATFGAIIAVGFNRQIVELRDTWPLLMTAQLLGVTAFMALGFLLGSMTARYLVLGINYAVIIEIGLGQIPIQLSGLSVLRNLKGVLAPIAPDSLWLRTIEPQGIVGTAAFLCLLTLVWLAGAAVLFSLQEFAGQRPKEA